MKPILVASLCALAATTFTADAQTGAPPGCDGLEHRDDFDFWIGEWDVYAPDGSLAGTNSIRETQNGCLIEEHWSGAQGSSGFSMNYYDPLTQAWRQVWMSASGYIDYSGGLNDDGEMALEGEIFYHSQGNRYPFRGVWTPNADGTVTQHFTQYDSESDSWNPWFTGTYVRRQADSNAHSGN